MSADAYHVYFGLRWEIDSSNQEEILGLERRVDTRQLAARASKLGVWWGRSADDNKFVLLIGTTVGSFGWEGKHSVDLPHAELSRIADETSRALVESGLEGEPAWHFQFQPSD